MKLPAVFVLVAALLCQATPLTASDARSEEWTIRDGKLHVDGTIDVSLEPLARLIDAIHAKGMFPCLSVETYGVGGGQIPQPFWDRHPEAIAISADGKEARDLEYGFKTAVPSILHTGYREASRGFIRNLVAGVPHKKILFYETTVEPQFMGHQDLDYSPSAKQAYEAWLTKQQLDGPAWPGKFPVPGRFCSDPVWLRFKAESLADWVNGDAAAFRDVAGNDAYIAVDYLETCNATLAKGTGFGWDFVNVTASSRDKFALYSDDWSPKPLMAEVDDHWPEWQKLITARAAGDAHAK